MTNDVPITGEFGIAAPTYRLPAETHVGGVTLQVSNLERSLRYYETVLGLRLLARDEGSAALGVPGAGDPLVRLRERAGARPIPRQGRLGLYHFAILLPDRAALGRFLAHLAAERVQAGMSDHLVSEALYLRDPDGLGIEVYADRPRSEWRLHGRELEMATAALDARSVLEAGDGKEWTGMPAGTRMGHVHLHVGDLDRAEDFYHAALGLDKVVWSYPGALFLSAGGYHHHLGVNTWAAGAPPAGEDEARLLRWELILPTAADADAAAGRLEAAGYAPEQADGGWSIRDPWGTPLLVRGA